MKRKEEGVITVYLTLTLLIVTSLLFVMIESARTAAGRYILNNAARLAEASVLADYSDALYEGYHVFARETGALTDAGRKEFVRSGFKRVLEANLSDEGAFLWKVRHVDIRVPEVVSITDYDGAFFRQQAVSYMEYRGTAMAAEALLDMFGLFGDSGSASALFEKEEAACEALSKIDSAVLKLMQYVDGIRIGDDGVQQGITGKVKTVSDFVKKMVCGEPDMDTVSVAIPEIFNALKDKYENPLEYAEAMYLASEEYASEKEGQAKVQKEFKQLYDRLAALLEAPTFSEAAEIAELKYKTDMLEMEYYAIELKLQGISNRFTEAKKKLTKLVESCLKGIEGAVLQLTKIKTCREESRPEIYGFLESLNEAVSWLAPDILDPMWENAEIMEEYLGSSETSTLHVPDIDGMEETLVFDRNVLQRLQDAVRNMDVSTFSKSDKAALTEIMSSYSYDSLCFDYSGMSLKSSAFDPMGTVRSLMENGILGIVAEDVSKLSDKEYTGEDLPGNLMNIGTQTGADSIFSGSITDLMAGSPLNAVGEMLKNGASGLAEKALYTGYLFDSFGYYDHEKDGTKCCYELEYILGGNLKDRDNLAGVITKILSVRAVMSLIHIFSSREKRAETYAFAASILGFTGMPMLIRVLQVLVIFVWAFEEALVETAALLRGKKVKIIADDSSFAVSFPEVFLMGKTLINEKAGAFNGATGLDYKSYLIMLLLVEKESTCNYRTMDVIQENIRQKNDSFRMSSLIYGFNIEADFELPALFRVFGGNTAYIFGFCGGERY